MSIHKIRFSIEYNLYEKFLDTSINDSRITNKFITFTEQLIELEADKENIKV